jgi:PAS domain S-box-containing protein
MAGAAGQRYEAIVRSSGEAILSSSANGTIESWNPAAESLYGYSANEMIGASVGVLGTAGIETIAVEWDPERQGRPVSLETRARRKDGSVVDVSLTLSPIRDAAGKVAGVVSVVRGVSETARNAERLAEAESRFAGTFEAASTGMALTAPDGRFLAVNAALCRFLHRDAATLLASCVQEVTHPDDLPADLEQGKRALAGEIDSFQQAKRYVLPAGGIVWGLLTISISRDAQGAPQHYVSQVEDITNRKTAEGEIRRYAAHLQALSERDALTGLLNLRSFEAAVNEELHVLKAGGNPCSVLLVKIDGDDGAVTSAADSLAGASRDADLSAHLGNGELAVLLPSVDRLTAPEIVERIAEAVQNRGVRSAHATARSGETAAELLRRARENLPDYARSVPVQAWAKAPEGITRLLELVRGQLDTPVAFLTRMIDDEYIFVRFAGDSKPFGLAEGDTLSLADSYCQRLLDGRIAAVVPDLAADPKTRDLNLTTKLGLRAYAGVPVRLRSGEIYGTLCGVDTRPHPEFTERHAQLLGFLGELTAELIEHETSNPEIRLVQAADAGVRTLLAALQARDFYTSSHSRQVVELASAVARRLGLDQGTTRDVEQVALLHDIGKVGIPDAILQKQGPLDAQEWQLMRQHPVVGEHIIAGTPGLARLAPAIRAEHERWDGDGYPDGLAGRQIPIASRITLACDALNAMTSDRPYRTAMTPDRAAGELQSCAGTQFDPQIIEALLAEISKPPTASTKTRPASGGPRQAIHGGVPLSVPSVSSARAPARAATIASKPPWPAAM